MKIVNRELGAAADASSERHSAFKELYQLIFAALILAVVIFVAIGWSVDLVVRLVPVAREAQLFSSVSGRLLKGSAGAEQQDILKPVAAALAKLTADPEVQALPYRLILLETSQTNAFAFPGGTIGVTSGLVSCLDQEIELAFVLAHELGHFKQRDHLRGIGRAVGVGVAYGILFGGQMSNDAVGTAMATVLQRGYSRRQEDAADRFAVGLVHRVYGRTDGVDKLFRLLRERAELPGWAYMFSTHPSADRRIQALAEYARALDGSAPGF